MTIGECDRAGVKTMSATMLQKKQQHFLSEMLLLF